MRLSVTIDGLDKVLAEMKKLDDGMRKKYARQAAAASAAVVRKYARQGAKSFDDPETARRLWKAVRTKFQKSNIYATEITADIGVYGPRKGEFGIAHWSLLEFGTSKMPAQPFLRPALSEHTQEAYDAAFKRLQKALKL